MKIEDEKAVMEKSFGCSKQENPDNVSGLTCHTHTRSQIYIHIHAHTHSDTHTHLNINTHRRIRNGGNHFAKIRHLKFPHLCYSHVMFDQCALRASKSA